MGGRHSQFQPGHRESFWDGRCERNTNGNGGGLNHNEYRGRTASESGAGVWPSAVCSARLCRSPTATYPAPRLRSGAVRGPLHRLRRRWRRRGQQLPSQRAEGWHLSVLHHGHLGTECAGVTGHVDRPIVPRMRARQVGAKNERVGFADLGPTLVPRFRGSILVKPWPTPLTAPPPVPTRFPWPCPAHPADTSTS
jgi:hypothetical protein